MAADAAATEELRMRLMQEMEVEMMTDMYNRLTSSCHKKCVPPKYAEGDLGKGEAVCLDRCVAKYLDIHDRLGRKLSQMSGQTGEDLLKNMPKN